MLPLLVPVIPEQWDEINNEFIPPVYKTLELEHSLVSISEWESKWCKPFLTKQEKTPQETLDYIRCMTLSKDVDPDIYNHLTQKNIEEIEKYIHAPMTATTFSEDKNKKSSREVITSELIYCWMTQLQIPSEYEKWHLNRLLTLIRVCEIKNSPPKKQSKRDIMSRNAAINAANRKRFNSKG